MDAAELPLVYHIGLVLAALWAAGALGIRHSVLFLLAFIYLYMVGTTSDPPQKICLSFLSPPPTFLQEPDHTARRFLSFAFCHFHLFLSQNPFTPFAIHATQFQQRPIDRAHMLSDRDLPFLHSAFSHDFLDDSSSSQFS
jgi:hypothetical protein